MSLFPDQVLSIVHEVGDAGVRRQEPVYIVLRLQVELALGVVKAVVQMKFLFDFHGYHSFRLLCDHRSVACAEGLRWGVRGEVALAENTIALFFYVFSCK